MINQKKCQDDAKIINEIEQMLLNLNIMDEHSDSQED